MEFILTLLIFIFVTGWLLAKFFPLVLAWYLKRKMKNGGSSFGGFNGSAFGNMYTGTQNSEDEVKRSKEQEGKVTVTTMEQKEKVIEKNMGEYIDFEEEK